MYVRMYLWVDGWMDGWMVGWMHHVCMRVCTVFVSIYIDIARPCIYLYMHMYVPNQTIGVRINELYLLGPMV